MGVQRGRVWGGAGVHSVTIVYLHILTLTLTHTHDQFFLCVRGP